MTPRPKKQPAREKTLAERLAELGRDAQPLDVTRTDAEQE